MTENVIPSSFIELTAEIVSAYVSNNSVSSTDLPDLLASIHSALTLAARGRLPEKPDLCEPAVAVSDSVTADFIICLEDGRKFKVLTRHLRTAHNLTPDEYRIRWDLPRDYPMVAPTYAKTRSNIAKSMGLGRKSMKVFNRKRRKKEPAGEGKA